LTIESLPQAGTVLNVRVQISADGVNWMDEGTAFPALGEVGHYFVKVRHFGGWLRLKGRVQQRSEAEDESAAAVPATANLSIHLTLKAGQKPSDARFGLHFSGWLFFDRFSDRRLFQYAPAFPERLFPGQPQHSLVGGRLFGDRHGRKRDFLHRRGGIGFQQRFFIPAIPARTSNRLAGDLRDHFAVLL